MEVAAQGLAAPEPERVELAALGLLRDGVARKEADAEALAGGALHGFGRAKLPNARWLNPDRAQLALDISTRARVGLAAEQRQLLERFRVELALVRRDKPRLRDAHDLVGEERLECDPLVGLVDADDCQLDAAGEKAPEDGAARGDFDLDVDSGIVPAEAAECVWQ